MERNPWRRAMMRDALFAGYLLAGTIAALLFLSAVLWLG